MTKWVLIIVFSFLTSACAMHNYRIEGNDLVFTLKKPEAKNVVLYCSHDGFKPRMAENNSGNWEVRLPASEGFRYFYMVDDAPFIPDCSMKEIDDLGSENCIFEPHL
jgi:1,4-alpha-glucan branching enzyme